jgi:LPXTG-motif cell wall-anchored protein
MFKKIALLAATAALALTLPCLAFAEGSPTGDNQQSATGSNSTITIETDDPVEAKNLVVEPDSTPDAVSSVAVGTILDTYTVYMSDGSDLQGSLTLTFNVGAQYAGRTVHVYGVDASGNTVELIAKVVGADGTITFTADALPYYTISVDETSSSVAPDSSAKSPSTGVNPLTLAVAAGAAVVLAGAVVIARKKIAE